MTVIPPSSDSDLFERVRLRGNPVASPGSTVVCGQARFTLLTSRLIRMEWSSNGVFEDRATFAFPNRAADVPDHTLHDEDGHLTIRTDSLELRYREDGRPFSEENPEVTLRVNGRPVTWKPGTPARGNLRGTTRTLDGARGQVRLSEGLVSRDGWAVHDDSKAILFTEGGGWIAPRPTHDQQDWYFFGYGHAYTDALSEYMQFGLPAPLIPRFVLGAWWSRYWAYSDQDLKDLVDDFEKHGLPLDVLVVDMDWHTPEAWTGYTWNRELFPDPEGFLKWVHERGLRVTLNLHPAEGVQPFEEAYPEFARRLGMDPQKKEGVTFRPGDPAFVQQYFELLHHPMEEQGVDFWWVDWQQGEVSEIPGLDPLLWLNHLHFLDSARRGQRPMLYSRWGGLGNHRYYIGFSGDTYAAWPALAFLPYFTATASNVAYGWWSHDIGGHFGADEPELYARWVQYGALSPCLRLHASKNPVAERRPWTFPEPVFGAAKAAFRWRYRILPYLYTMARLASDTGVPLCRPLYYDYPESDAAYLARDEYYLGDAMIAAPIVSPSNPETGMASVDVWVPEGTWIDYDTLETFEGPRWVRLVGDLTRVPKLVREGAILPLAADAPNTGSIPRDRLILQVFPGREGSFRLYEDDGETPAYLRGEYEWTPMTMKTEVGTCELIIGPTEGQCPALPRSRNYKVQLVGTKRPERVLIDGTEASDWHYRGDTQTTVIEVPATDKSREVRVSVSAEREISTLSSERNRRCVEEDVRRLLGTAYPDVGPDDLPAAVMTLEHPGREDAIARLGGPFVHVNEYSALPEAAERLGDIVIVAPADGTGVDCTVTWTLHGSGQPEQREESLQGLREDTLLTVPFRFHGEARALYWEADIRMEWRGGTLVKQYRSATLFPTMPVWRVAVQEQQALEQVAGNSTSPSGDVCEQEPGKVASLTEVFYVDLSEKYGDRLKAGQTLVAFASVQIAADHDRDVIIAWDTPGSVTWRVNGQTVVERPEDKNTAVPDLPIGHSPRLSIPVHLRAGANRLELEITSTTAREWALNFTTALLDPDGTVATGLRYEL